MSKISIVIEVDAIPLSSVLGEAYRKYYFYDGSHFLFASEQKALLPHGAIPKELDKEAI